MSQIEKLGMDSVKLHCCDKATIPGCRKLCLKTFTNEWATSWNDFDSECLSHPKEEKLVRCLDDGKCTTYALSVIILKVED